MQIKLGKGQATSLNKRSRIYQIKNFKIENFEIAKSFLGSLRVQRYIVFMSLHDSSASYWTSKNGLPCDLSKMPEAITFWPLLVELQYWLSRLQRVRLPYRPGLRFLWNMRVLILEFLVDLSWNAPGVSRSSASDPGQIIGDWHSKNAECLQKNLETRTGGMHLLNRKRLPTTWESEQRASDIWIWFWIPTTNLATDSEVWRRNVS